MDNPARSVRGACSFCRKRKLRCDKQLPRCQSCIRLGQECIYLGSRSAQHRPRTERTHVEELEERLRRVEGLLRRSREVPHPSSDEANPSPAADSGHEDHATNDGNCSEMLPDAEAIHDLEKTYFENIYPIMPIIHMERYTSYQTFDGGTWPPMYLRYSIWAVAAIGLDQHPHQSIEYYTKARKLTEAAALSNSQPSQSPLYRSQAWLHLAMYDMMSGRFALAWTSTSQAVRLLQIAKVHNLDNANASSASKIFNNCSCSEAEERRRAFWFAYCMDRSAFIGQGLPNLINEKDIRVNLPASDKSYQSSTEQPGITLSQAASGSSQILSPLSATAVVYSLCSSSLADLQKLDATSICTLFATSDWMMKDCKSLAPVFCVPSYLAATIANLDANLLYLNVMVHCATIQVHRMAQKLARTSPSPLAMRFVQESTSQCLKAASAIFELAILTSQSQLSHHHPATFWCFYNALVVFADCFLAKRDIKLSSPIRFLIDFMKSLRDKSQIANKLFRDFELEYQPLVMEFSSKSQNTFTGMDIEESSLQPPQNIASVKDTPSGGPVYDDAEDWASCVTDSILYDAQDALSWNTQGIDMNYSSLFQNANGFVLDSNLGIQPK